MDDMTPARERDEDHGLGEGGVTLMRERGEPDLTLVRELGEDVPPLGDPARLTARARLLAEVAAAEPRMTGPRARTRQPAAWRRPLPRRLAVAGLAAAVIAPVLLLAGGGGGTPGAPVQPAIANPILLRAAETAGAQAAVIPGDDQYVYANEMLHETRVDGGGEPEVFHDESWRSVDGSRPTRTSERGRSWITPPTDGGLWPPTRYEDLEQLPTDPARLRDAIGRGDWATPADRREHEVTSLLMLLRGWRVMPPDLRGAIFGALAELPEVQVDEDVRDARGRSGIGISAPDTRGANYEIIVDRETFAYLGMRGVRPLRRSDGVEVHQLTALVDHGIVDRMGQRP